MAPIILSIFFLIINLLFTAMTGRTLRSSELHENGQNNTNRISVVETAYGDFYQCIEAYKPHSLQHHKVEKMPMEGFDTLPDYKRNKKKKNSPHVESKKGCPEGTMPIRRTTIEDQKIVPNGSLKFNGGIDFAGFITNPGTVYYGASGSINIANPQVYTDQEYSSAIISLEAGDASNLNQIQVGWTVNPQLYGDYRTRFLTSWTIDNFVQTGCFNARCPGFIVVDNDSPLDYPFPNISVSEGPQYEVYISVLLWPGYGWILNRDGVFVGYWPSSLFTELQNKADQIRFGGEVFTPSGHRISSPQMGNGVFKYGPPDQSCYMRRVMVVHTANGPESDVDNSFVTDFDSRCFLAGGNGYKDDTDRYIFYFGGSGGTDGSTCYYEEGL